MEIVLKYSSNHVYESLGKMLNSTEQLPVMAWHLWLSKGCRIIGFCVGIFIGATLPSSWQHVVIFNVGESEKSGTTPDFEKLTKTPFGLIFRCPTVKSIKCLYYHKTVLAFLLQTVFFFGDNVKTIFQALFESNFCCKILIHVYI